MAQSSARQTEKKKAPRTPFLRLLPILIVVAALMLSIRVNDLRKGFLESATVGVTAELHAQQAEPKVAPSQAQQQTAPTAAKPQQAQPQLAQAPTAAPGPGPAPESSRSASLPPPPPVGGDAGALSQTEMDVLQKLTERRTTLDGREKDIERRESMLKAAEDQIDRKVSEMRTLQTTIEGLLRQYNDQEDNKMRSLVKIYENMKPKEAAKIFEQLDMPIMLEVVERMKEQKVAPILAEMDPSKAKNVTAELAQRRQIPLPKPSSGG